MNFSGTKDASPRPYEIEHAKISRRTAAEGMVLLKNDNNVLPLKQGEKIALFGPGASKTIKGGTGSGDVNSRYSVSIREGLAEAGFEITTNQWLDEYDTQYMNARYAWKDELWKKAEDGGSIESATYNLFQVYSTNPFKIPAGPLPTKTEAEIAIYVLSRTAGEGADRNLAEGDYYLTEDEKNSIFEICRLYKSVILLINTGGIIDLEFVDEYNNIDTILYISQPGQEGGHAVADILLGNVVPSGKLTDSWPLAYSDIPFAEEYSHLNGDVNKDYYKQGIYVGYRYFDTFDVPVRYCFGYGLSYTNFATKVRDFTCADNWVKINVEVSNIGKIYSGRQVVQVYISAPQQNLKKEYRRLVSFKKTNIIAPGESETIELRFPVRALSSFDEKEPGWVIDKGEYGIFLGESLGESCLVGSIKADNRIILDRTEHICPLKEELEELSVDNQAQEKRNKWLPELPSLPQIKLSNINTRVIDYNAKDTSISQAVWDLVDSLDQEQLIKLATGEFTEEFGASNLGSSGIFVPGSAAQTSGCATENGIRPIVLADGPAGLRLTKEYYVKDNELVPFPFEDALEGGFLSRNKKTLEGEKWYQYCTAFPVGTLLAQSWDVDLVRKVGEAVAAEMREFNVTLWLAPGMNIHKNPLCGRNFEYYSEDPVVTGLMAAAMTSGVQSISGCGTTIKHFACNSQEDNRIGVDAVVSERALREIYLKGFEIAIETSQPLSIMTSYNLINGVHAANCYDICTKAARLEWGFKGYIMTDWLTTMHGPDCTAAGCMRAGNDGVMPGLPMDHDNIRQELESGTLDIADLKRSVANLVKVL